MSEFYKVAKGRMAEVWARLECPVCGDEMEHVGDDYEDEKHLDTYSCEYCRILITYVSPAKYHEYHEVPDSERCYLIERSF